MSDSQTLSNRQLARLLTAGGDDRLHVCPESGRNKYLLDVHRFEGLFNRGSCTANLLTQQAQLGLRGIDEPLRTFEGVVEEQARRIRALITEAGSTRDFEVFFAPSGTDLAYYPLIFQRVIHPKRPLVTILSCHDETGSGSVLACQARFFGRCNQFGAAVEKGSHIDVDFQPRVVRLAARNHEGSIAERTDSLRKIVAENSQASIIATLVCDSKSGIRDDLQIINETSEVMWVVDACQFRADLALIGKAVDAGTLVMLTGSKFFEAPSFCGFLLVPRRWCKALAAKDAATIAPFGAIFSAHDVPRLLERIRTQLPRTQNWPLRHRIEIALDAIEAYKGLNPLAVRRVIAVWNRAVTKRIASSASLRLMNDQDKTHPSIVSFQVRGPNGLLDRSALERLFERVCTSTHDRLRGGLDRVYLGQPVQFPGGAFLRLALGASDVHEFVRSHSLDLHNDFRLIEILESRAEQAS